MQEDNSAEGKRRKEKAGGGGAEGRRRGLEEGEEGQRAVSVGFSSLRIICPSRP